MIIFANEIDHETSYVCITNTSSGVMAGSCLLTER